MSTLTTSTTTSYVAECSDGTPIAVITSGSGRPLVLVPGTRADHTSWRLAHPDLETAASVHAVDRCGRGASGDHDDYSVEREFADVIAVVDKAAARWGGPVDLVGHSFGGMVCFGVAARTRNVRRMVLYEG
jgi:pimeloyl-ACP methyl ester carboxylesterase